MANKSTAKTEPGAPRTKEERLRLVKARLIGIGIAVALLAAAAGVFARFWPLEAGETWARLTLGAHGVHETELGGLHAYVRDACQGKTPGRECACVALVHGLADQALTWKRVLAWPAEGWAQPVKLYAFDMTGSGKTPPAENADDYRVRRQAEILRHALELECPRWVVVGNSLGGWVAAWLALDWPDGVDKLLLVDSAGLKSEVEDNLQFFVTPTVENMQEFLRRAFSKPHAVPAYVWPEIVERMKHSEAKRIIAAQKPDELLDGRLPALRRPTMVFWGHDDRITLRAAGREMQSLIPGSVWREVMRCGHVPQKECPGDLVRAISEMAGAGAI